jgi:transcriptional repressor NrdR
MTCPACQGPSRVLESRSAEGGVAVRRRRQCSRCGHRFTTYERSEPARLSIRKRDGTSQPFDRVKLLAGLVRAAHKRPLPAARLDALVDRIEAEVTRAGGELPAQRVGEMCLAGLKGLDRIAYLQFAAVYKEFADLDEVSSELALLRAEKGRSNGRNGESDSVRPEAEDAESPAKTA